MALNLLDKIMLLHPYTGHILGIFLNVHVILLGQRECATDQTCPYFQTVLFVHLVEGHGTHLMTPRPDGCVAGSSRIFILPPEDKRRWMPLHSLLALASTRTPSGLRGPSASDPKVVSLTVAPRSLGPAFGRGAASTPWAPSAPRSATLRAGRRDGVR